MLQASPTSSFSKFACLLVKKTLKNKTKNLNNVVPLLLIFSD